MNFSLSWLVLVGLSVMPGMVVGQASDATKAAGTAAAPVDRYAAEPVVVERLDTVYRFAADGTGTKELTGVMRIQSEAAARQFGVLTIPYASSSERIELQYVRVRKPDGSVVETSVGDAQDMPQEITRQAPFYSDLKEKQIPIRSLRVGDRLEYKATSVRVKAEVPGEFWGQENFGAGVVVLQATVELHVPQGKYVKVWSPEHAPVVSEAGGEKVYRWTGSQLTPVVQSDAEKKQAQADAAKKEHNPEGELAPVAWTTFKSWEAVGAWYRMLEGDRAVADGAVKAKVAELTAGKSTDDEKIRALYGYVATQIRYIGVAFGVGRYQPHAAGEVLQNQYGDCKDKHTLLAAMLGAAGFHADAAMIGAGIRMNEEVPSPAAFNHMITALPMGGSMVWMDATAEVAPYRMLVSVVRDRRTLVVPDQGAAMLERTPKGLPFVPFSAFTAVGKLGVNGTANTHMEYVTRGDDELVLRALFRQVSPGQWDQLTQAISQQLGFAGTTSHAEASRPDATAEPERLSYDYEREKLGDWDNFRIVPLFPSEMLAQVDEKDPPQLPIQLGEPRVDTAKTVLELPKGWGVELPSELHRKTPYVSFDRTYAIDHEQLTVVRRVEIDQRQVPAGEWKAYKAWMDATLNAGEPYIQLTSTGTKGEVQGPPLAGSNNPAAAELVKRAYESVESGALNEAEHLLDEAKKINDKQERLWGTYGYLEALRQRFALAVEDYKKEVELHPTIYTMYVPLAQAQMNLGHYDDSVATMRTLVKLTPEDDTAAIMLASMLEASGGWAEIIRLLEPVEARSTTNVAVLLPLGIAELETGKTAEGQAKLVKVLQTATSDQMRNSAAYELASAGVELDLAEKSARSVVDKLSADSANWMARSGDLSQKMNQNLLVATWDTLGWALFKEGHMYEAESYVRAGWLNQSSPESGLHMGEIEEKRGHASVALKYYQMASILLQDSQTRPWSLMGREAVETKLKAKIAALEGQGVKSGMTDGRAALMQLRVFALGRVVGKNSMSVYKILIRDGAVLDLVREPRQEDARQGVNVAAQKDERLLQVKFAGWTPAGSAASLVREGVETCHSGVCELIVYPM